MTMTVFTGGGAPESSSLKGFTLAEVLITLGIIGIVAAMTLPTVMSKFQGIVLQNQLKKSYSVLSQAYMNTKTSLGTSNLRAEYATYDPMNLVYPNAEIFKKEFLKNIKATQKVTFYPVKNYSGTKIMTSVDSGADFPKALNILPDGSSVGIHINNGCIRFWVDTNGPKKLPNRYGFDVFEFQVQDESDMIRPVKQTRKYTEEELEKEPFPWLTGVPCNASSNQETNGMGCSYYAIIDKNPDDETKGYWANLPK